MHYLTPIKNQLRSQIFPHYSLCHKITQSNGLYDATFYCYAIEIVYDSVFCVKTETSIGYSARDKKQFNIIYCQDIEGKLLDAFHNNSHEDVSIELPVNSFI